MPPVTNTSMMPIPGSNFLDGLNALHQMMVPGEDDQSKGAQSARILQGGPGESSIANDPGLKTNYLRSQAKGEAMDHLAAALGVGDTNGAARQQTYIKGYADDEAQDPMSYQNVDARSTADINSRAAAQRQMGQPEMAARQQMIREGGQTAQVNAQGKGMGEAYAADSAPAQDVANKASGRHITETLAPQRAMSGQRVDGPFAGQADPSSGGGTGNPIDFWASAVQNDPAVISQVPTHMKEAVAIRQAQLGGAPMSKLSAQENDQLTKINAVSTLIPQITAMMEKETPGVTANPGQHRSPTDALVGWGGGVLYKHGMAPTEAEAGINQLTGYLEAVIPRLVQSGRMNQNQYTDLKAHAPQVGYSPGENMGRINYIKNNILPAVVNAIHQVHTGGAFSPPAGGGGDPTDPNWGR